jgi:hypothetical protein
MTIAEYLIKQAINTGAILDKGMELYSRYPLASAGGLIGGAAGAVKGSLEDIEENKNRLKNILTNSVLGATGGAVGGFAGAKLGKGLGNGLLKGESSAVRMDFDTDKIIRDLELRSAIKSLSAAGGAGAGAGLGGYLSDRLNKGSEVNE